MIFELCCNDPNNGLPAEQVFAVHIGELELRGIMWKACKPDAHHEDYSRPLDVVWVCRACHMDIHHTGRRRVGGKV